MKDMIDWLTTPPLSDGSDNQQAGPNQFVPAHLAQAPAISILVCNFDGPAGHEVGQRMQKDMASESGILIQHFAKRLKSGGKGTLVERLVAAAETGRKWLAGSSADVLIWGEVSPDDGFITLRLLCAQADGDSQPGSVGLGDTLRLPGNYDVAMAGLVHAAVLAAVGPRKSNPQRQELMDLLSEPADNLSALIETPPSTLDPSCFSSVMTAIGNILASMWRLNEDPARLDMAVKAYQASLKQSYDKDNPVNWALTQNHLASTLLAKSKQDRDPVPLRAAVEAYRGAAAALGSHLHVNDWALAQSHMGDALVKLANFENGAQCLKEASEAYQQALKVFTRQTMPGPWSELMNQLGIALMNLGEIVTSNRILEQSASCFRQSLDVRRREITPHLWAQTANNLGAVTFAIYKENENSSALHEAAACFKGASEVYGQLGRRDKALVAQRNMERIEEIQKGEAG